MGRPLDEWIKIYESKTGEEFEASNGFKLFYFPDRGFCEMAVIVQAKMVIARQMCGDALFWRQAVEMLCITLAPATVTGIALISSGGGSGTWKNYEGSA